MTNSLILLRQISRRSTGCDISDEKMPRLNSRPNESSAISTVPKNETAGATLMIDPSFSQTHGRMVESS